MGTSTVGICIIPTSISYLIGWGWGSSGLEGTSGLRYELLVAGDDFWCRWTTKMSLIACSKLVLLLPCGPSLNFGGLQTWHVARSSKKGQIWTTQNPPATGTPCVANATHVASEYFNIGQKHMAICTQKQVSIPIPEYTTINFISKNVGPLGRDISWPSVLDYPCVPVYFGPEDAASVSPEARRPRSLQTSACPLRSPFGPLKVPKKSEGGSFSIQRSSNVPHSRIMTLHHLWTSINAGMMSWEPFFPPKKHELRIHPTWISDAPEDPPCLHPLRSSFSFAVGWPLGPLGALGFGLRP